MGTVVDLHRLDFGISKILYTSHQRYIAFLSRGSRQPHQTCVPHFIRKTFSCLHLFYLSGKKTAQAHSLVKEIPWNATRRSLHSRLYNDLPPRIRDWIQRALVHEEDLQLIATELLERLRKYTRWVWRHFSTAWTKLRFFGMISDNRLSAKHHASQPDIIVRRSTDCSQRPSIIYILARDNKAIEFAITGHLFVLSAQTSATWYTNFDAETLPDFIKSKPCKIPLSPPCMSLIGLGRIPYSSMKVGVSLLSFA